eukprot:TRINITY_DN8252_c0_g1_i1.p1 TRINITY_DN8252_c0_g1~~TRINITY_DN8252_c0_g1_i1.p1  ORF type:complete len:104 (+),score=4.73 TRINITY_DN8252_c0_g1_i1:32-343(+)
MKVVVLSLIFLSLSATISCQLSISLNLENGDYSILVNGSKWFFSGLYALYMKQSWYTSQAGLKLTGHQLNQRNDTLGSYNSTILFWMANNIPFHTEVISTKRL